MRVPLGQLSVRSDSYPDGGRGDALRRSSGNKGLPWADPANLRAATCSESRAGSESTVVTPTRPLRGEGRRSAGKKPTRAPALVTRVVGSGTQGRAVMASEAHPFTGQRVEVRRAHHGVPRRRQAVAAELIECDEEDVHSSTSSRKRSGLGRSGSKRSRRLPLDVTLHRNPNPPHSTLPKSSECNADERRQVDEGCQCH
jgi:hypothetical protein